MEEQKHAKHQAMDQSGAGGLPAGHASGGLAEDTETGTGLPVEGEIVTSPSPSASAAEESETATSPSPSASAAVESETVTSPSPSIEASVSPSPSAETSPAPVETATKTIASFEALTPDLFVPQGTPETGLGLPASLNAQFTDGAAGEAASRGSAAGVRPERGSGRAVCFAAVLPEGYARFGGRFLPQILVTLTPPLANAMLMAQASGTGWTLSDDGTLTVKGTYVMSSTIDSFASVVKSIEICEGAKLILQSDFSGAVTVLYRGILENDKTFSGDITVAEDGYFYNDGTISGGTITGRVENDGTISGGTFNAGSGISSINVINRGTITDGTFSVGTVQNHGTIADGSFSGTVLNLQGEISGGTFTGELVVNDKEITGGTFNGEAVNEGRSAAASFMGRSKTRPRTP